MIAATDKPKYRWYQYSLRTLMLLVTVAAVWLGIWTHRAREQKKVVASIVQLGGNVFYDYQRENPVYYNVHNPKALPLTPQWLRSILDDDYFHDVVYVCLRDTKATDDDLEMLKKLPRLENLDLIDTAVTGAGLAHLKRHNDMKSLGLCNTHVDDAGLLHIAHLTELRQLMLDGTRVTGVGMRHLQGLTNLDEWLGLCDIDITDEDLKPLANLKKLRSLNLKGTKVTSAGVMDLQQALPRTDISYDRKP